MSIGYNKMRNDPAIVESDRPGHKGTIFAVHAEVDALSRVADPRGAVVYVARAAKSGEALSRPCDNCAEALIRAGVKSICYTT